MTLQQAIREMQAVGLVWIETGDFLPTQHFMVFEKPGLTSSEQQRATSMTNTGQ
jgi:hypothetical protein